MEIPVPTSQRWSYPVAHQDAVVEDFHGTPVPDPYRWLEDPDAPDTRAWVDAENDLTFGYLRSLPVSEDLRARLTEIWNFPKYTVPHKEGERYIFSKNDGLQNQFVIYMQKTLESEPTLVLDPNKLSEDGTVALMNQSWSKDGRLLAYGVSSSGSDWQEIRVRDVDRGQDYDDVIRWCKFEGIAWKHDG